MYVFFDPNTRKVTSTIQSWNRETPPPGDWVIYEGILPGPLMSLEVDLEGNVILADIGPLRDQYKREVIAGAVQVREKFAPGISGDDAIYLDKGLEAQRYLQADPEPNTLPDWDETYPFVAAEVGTTAATPRDVAIAIRSEMMTFRKKLAQIEGGRVQVNKALDNATTVSALETVMTSFRNQLAQILA